MKTTWLWLKETVDKISTAVSSFVDTSIHPASNNNVILRGFVPDKSHNSYSHKRFLSEVIYLRHCSKCKDFNINYKITCKPILAYTRYKCNCCHLHCGLLHRHTTNTVILMTSFAVTNLKHISHCALFTTSW